MFIASLDGGSASHGYLEKLAESHSFVCDVHVNGTPIDVRLPCYTLRWVVSGQLEIRVDGTPCSVAEQHYHLVNPGQRTAAEGCGGREAHILVICLSRALVHKAFEGIRATSRRLFRGNPDFAWPVSFDNRLRPHDETVSPILRDVLRVVELGVHDKLWLDQQLLILAEMLLFQESRRSAAARRANGNSLSRRLERARNVMDERFREPLSLNDLAGVAYASPHHFLRAFKKAYGATPHQYLTSRRLEAARNLLHTTDLPVSEIGARVGFASSNGFYKAFRRRYDCPPTAFRRQG